MKRPTDIRVEACRTSGPSGEPYGAFIIKCGAFHLRCIAAAGQGWDHVSVSLANRCPTWEEMDFIKRLFWSDDEVVMQLHINNGDKVNVHPHCLHLFRPQSVAESKAEQEKWAKEGEPNTEWFFPQPIPLPPNKMV
jgi:hypothetical protein